MFNHVDADIPTMITDAAKTQEYAQSLASALEPVHALTRQQPWADDDLTASFQQEYYQAITLAIDAHGLMAEKWAEVGHGIGAMATTTAMADDAARESFTRSADAGESAQWT